LRISLDRRYPPLNPDMLDAFDKTRFTHFQFFLKKYTGGLEKFKVYGFHYKEK
jgi:hypothetical protein